MSTASRRVARSFASTIEKPEGVRLRASRSTVSRMTLSDSRYSAGRSRCRTCCSSGKTQVTVVPRPTAESSFTVPPCSSTKERTIDRPSPAPRCSEPSAWLSNRSNTRSPISAGMPGPRSVTREHDRVVAPLDGRAARSRPRGEKLDRVRQQVEQDLPHAPLVGHEAADVGRGAHVEQDRLARRAGPARLRPRHRPRRGCRPPSRSSVIAPASMVARSRMSLMMASSALDEASM